MLANRTLRKSGPEKTRDQVDDENFKPASQQNSLPCPPLPFSFEFNFHNIPFRYGALFSK